MTSSGAMALMMMFPQGPEIILSPYRVPQADGSTLDKTCNVLARHSWHYFPKYFVFNNRNLYSHNNYPQAHRTDPFWLKIEDRTWTRPEDQTCLRTYACSWGFLVLVLDIISYRWRKALWFVNLRAWGFAIISKVCAILWHDGSL